MKKVKRKKLDFKKLTIAKLENPKMIKGGTIIIRPTYNYCEDSEIPEDCPGDTETCPSTRPIQCQIVIGRR